MATGKRKFKNLAIQDMTPAQVDALRKIDAASRVYKEEGKAQVDVRPSAVNGIDGRTAASLYRGGLLSRREVGSAGSARWAYRLTDAGSQMLAQCKSQVSSEETICESCNEFIPLSEAQ